MLSSTGNQFSHAALLTAMVLAIAIFAGTTTLAQNNAVNTLPFSRYKPSDFRGKLHLNYSIYVTPMITVDPLGLGGKSAYALSLGTRIHLWESKQQTALLSGLQLRGIYGALGYEYFPQQFDNFYGSLWFRIKTFIPISARMDALYSFGEGRHGIASRFCFGVEVRTLTLLLSGTIYSAGTQQIFGEHPVYYTDYSNAGAIMLVIPFYRNEKAP
jgi:hypothetical protein